MKRFPLAILIALLISFSAHADVIKTVQADATDQTVTLRIIDSTDGTPETGVVFNTSGIDLEYWRHGANAAVDITEATQTVNGAHTDGGFVHVGHGVYRLDLPDAAVATGVTAVDVYGTVTGMIVLGGTVQISPPVNVHRFGGTGVTGRDIGASVLLSSGTGTGQLSISSGLLAWNPAWDAEVESEVDDSLGGGTGTSLTAIPWNASWDAEVESESNDALVLNHLDHLLAADYDPASKPGVATALLNELVESDSGVSRFTANALEQAPAAGGVADADLGIIASGTAQSATGTTLRLASAEIFADDEIIGATILITGGSAGVGQSRTITDYVSSTDTATVETWTTTPTGTITYNVFGTAASTGGGGLDAAGVRAALGFASANADTQFSGIQSDTDNIQTRIPAALVSGRIDASVGAMATGVVTATAVAADAIGASELAADAGTEIGNATWASTTRLLTAGTNIVLAKGAGVTGFNDLSAAQVQAEAEDAINVRLEQATLADAAVVNCTVNTANFAGSTTTVACILTDRDAGAITAATGDLEGRELLILSGAQIYEGRFINDTTWDGANSELQLTLSRALPGTLADAVTAIIR